MNTNYSALTRAGNHFIDWKTSTDPPRSRGRRVRPLLWIAALFVVTASVSVAGQTERNTERSWLALAERDRASRAGRSHYRPTAAPPSWVGLSTRSSPGGLDLHTQQRHLEPTRHQAGGHRRGRTSRTRRLRRAVCRWQDRDGGWTI